jgi:hypothetical protein
MAKTILILTGPQGSGNHLWSKIFALHPGVKGWSALLDQYWIGHDQEPFAEYWRDPEQLKYFPWAQSDWYVTSISVPYMDNGTATVPDFKAFVTKLQLAGVRVKFAVLGRDRNIVQHQQTRVRGAPTLATALAEFDQFAAPVFLSYELLHLYGAKYLENVSQQLSFPIATTDPRLQDILATDTNTKYFQPVDTQPLDADIKKASSKRK